MKKLFMFIALAGMMSAGAWADNGTPKQEAQDRLDRAATVLQQVSGAADKGIPDEVIKGAKCIAVVPRMIKAGFIFGGKHGRGVATCKTATGWSAPAFFTITGGSWGAQIGVEGVDLVMMIMNQKGMENLMANKFQVGGEASAAAGPVGRHASAGTDWKAETQILTYSRSKGLFAGIDLGGSWIAQDATATDAYYGRAMGDNQILGGKISAPSSASSDPFVAEVHVLQNRLKAEAAAK